MFKRYAIWVLVITISVTGVMVLAAQKLLGHKSYVSLNNYEALMELEAEELLNDPHYALQFIRTGQPELLYNCHGWTFTGGKRSVTLNEVERLLRTRYREVTEPEPEDIVIYYDARGELCHSGVVKATGKKGFVLVESKWGGFGRFLHLLDAPQVQARHVFYHRQPARKIRPACCSAHKSNP